MDNLAAHKVAGVRQAIEAAGAVLLYLPPYSPDLNPIERKRNGVSTRNGVDSRVRRPGSGGCGGPGPRGQFCEPAVGPVVNKLCQHVGEIGLRIDAVQLAGLDQRRQHCPVFRPVVAAGEESIFSIESDRAHAAFNGIGVDLDAAVVEKAHQPVPAAQTIADGLGQRGSAGELDQGSLKPSPQRFDKRLGRLRRAAQRSSALVPRISAST